MDTRITASTAQAQYYNRPADERFPTLDALVAAARTDMEHSTERVRNPRDLRAVVGPNGNVRIASPAGEANLTHWSFGQLARTVGAPASYLRENLSPDLAAACLTYGLRQTPPASDLKLLIRAPQHGASDPTPTIRAATTERYSRVWDGPLYQTLAQTFGIGSTGSAWTLPPTWDGRPAGAYRSDRDSFVIVVNGGSIVQDPSRRDGNGAMYRGLIIRNSEVGAASITILPFTFRWICGNHMIGGFQAGKLYRRRHIGADLNRKTMREIMTLAHAWANRGAAGDEAIIRRLIDLQLAETKDAVIDELRGIGFTEADATAAYETAEQTEPNLSPRSYWGLVQGATRASQERGYQDERLTLDLLASKLLNRGVAKVAA